MTEKEAIKVIETEKQCVLRNSENGCDRDCICCDLVMAENDIICGYDTTIKALEEIQKYRAIGTVEEIQKMKKEEDILKFYYCESEDEYYIGKRIDTMYYGKYSKTGFTWCLSRNLPWGEHVVAPNTLWKEHTYPSEPKEIPFFEWLQGFIKKECLGTAEECREAVERKTPQKPKREVLDKDLKIGNVAFKAGTQVYLCPSCEKGITGSDAHCRWCGQAIDWSTGV